MSVSQAELSQISTIVAMHELAGRLDLEQSEQLHRRLVAGVASFREQWATVVEGLGGGDPTPTADELVFEYLHLKRAFHLVFHPAEVAARGDELAIATGMSERRRFVLGAALLGHDVVQDTDVMGRPRPDNEARSSLRTIRALEAAGVPIDASLALDSETITMATVFGADRTTEIHVVGSELPEDACARADLTPRQRLELATACNIASDADIAGVAFRTSALDNRLFEIEMRRLGPAKVRALQESFIDTLARRAGGPFRTPEANALWDSRAFDGLDRYQASLDARMLAPVVGR
jgi:hypothetical protein